MQILVKTANAKLKIKNAKMSKAYRILGFVSSDLLFILFSISVVYSICVKT